LLTGDKGQWLRNPVVAETVKSAELGGLNLNFEHKFVCSTSTKQTPTCVVVIQTLLSYAMPDLDHIPCTQQRKRRNYNSLRLQCGNCNQWFKSHSGRTRHQLSAHPILTALTRNSREDTPSTGSNDRVMSPPPPVDGMDDATMDSIENADDPPQFPEPNIGAEFFGPGDHLYRNYHTELNGMFTFAANFSAAC